MAVLIEAISVIFPVSVLEDRYPGGLTAYERNFSNEAYCCDGRLARVAFAKIADVIPFIRGLHWQGLNPIDGDKWAEVAIVKEGCMSATAPRAWLTFKRKSGGLVFACLKDDRDVPADTLLSAAWKCGGTPSQQSGYVPTEQVNERYRFLRYEWSFNVYVDCQKGKEVVDGRITSSPAMNERRVRLQKPVQDHRSSLRKAVTASSRPLPTPALKKRQPENI